MEKEREKIELLSTSGGKKVGIWRPQLFFFSSVSAREKELPGKRICKCFSRGSTNVSTSIGIDNSSKNDKRTYTAFTYTVCNFEVIADVWMRAWIAQFPITMPKVNLLECYCNLALHTR